MQKDVRAGWRYICKQTCELFATKIKHRTTSHTKYKTVQSTAGQKVIAKENAKNRPTEKKLLKNELKIKA